MQKRWYIVGCQGFAEEKALKNVAAVVGKEAALRFCLHAFCDDFETQAVCQGQGGEADGGIVLVGLNVLDERAIQLEGLDGQQLEVGQGGIAGTEIVNRQFHAHCAQGLQLCDGPLRVFHRHRLGHLQFELTRSDAVPYIGVGTARAELADKQPEVLARVIAALRDTLAWGSTHRDEVVQILRKKANLPEDDARAYAGQWDALNRVGFEPADIATLRLQHQVFSESGLVKGALRDDLFTTRPYELSKTLK